MKYFSRNWKYISAPPEMTYFRPPQLNLLKKKGFFRGSSNDLTKYRAAGKTVIEARPFRATFSPQKSKN